MEKRKKSDKHIKKDKFNNVVKGNFSKDKNIDTTGIVKLKMIKNELDATKGSTNKFSNLIKRKKTVPTIKTDKQFADFIKDICKGKKITENIAEVVGTMTSFNSFAQAYLKTIETAVSTSSKVDIETIQSYKEISKGLLKHLTENAEVITVEERVAITQQLAEITNNIALVNVKNKKTTEIALKVAEKALLVAGAALLLFIQNQMSNDKDNNTIDMDDHN
ncbi:hypothetical protein O0Q50_18760 [Priestia aryabhattai]|uniref:Uncharacterized protein n=1 Tax=Priestia aryabhattai TaxID=412384 RepID=A0AAX6NC21_PRIAR|nr:hypothetical protein [Priestia aryabhattai]MDU9693220.1 hypothetical protein [Priestia aryabhattai]